MLAADVHLNRPILEGVGNGLGQLARLHAVQDAGHPGTSGGEALGEEAHRTVGVLKGEALPPDEKLQLRLARRHRQHTTGTTAATKTSTTANTTATTSGNSTANPITRHKPCSPEAWTARKPVVLPAGIEGDHIAGQRVEEAYCVGGNGHVPGGGVKKVKSARSSGLGGPGGT